MKTKHKLLHYGLSLLTAGAALFSAIATAQAADKKPNVVFILADNLGYGEIGSYGGGVLRGAPTPRIDSIATAGTRLLNFNVEPSCTPSRSALMVGRHPIRSGTTAVPIDGRPYGLVQWEITIAELLSKQGYATAHFGKWHLGDSEGRYPNDQGFDESKQFAGKTGNGDWADMLAQMDWCVGQILDAVADLKIDDNTIFIFTSDNGPEDTYPWRGWSGPWSGSYVTAMEGSLRVSFLIRWPGKIPAGRVSNEMVHIVDMYTTLARMGGADIPTDRAVDGVDQTAFFLGKEQSAREFFPIFLGTAVGNELYAMKWRNWKLHAFWQERMDDAPKKLAVPRMFDLHKSPQERPDESLNTAITNAWVLHAMFKSLQPFQESLKKYPPIATGTSDPYVPPAAR